uniref:Uncharacterized protein n=1 Tax=Molossus molossus TaxID=27622 RepID=A0A7J8HD22_MOLMO|nr:hypothetical protein HJG59_011192 [Molossus molossus]
MPAKLLACHVWEDQNVKLKNMARSGRRNVHLTSALASVSPSVLPSMDTSCYHPGGCVLSASQGSVVCSGDALRRVMETWNLEGAVWSSLPPQSRISPGSQGTRWGWGCLAFAPPASDIIACHPLKGAHVERGRNHIVSSRVYGASCTFKKAYPLGYEYVCMCVSACAFMPVCVCVCVCVCVSAPGVGRELRKVSGPMEGDFEMFLSFRYPCSSVHPAAAGHLLSMRSVAGATRGRLSVRKSGCSQAERGLDWTGARQW